MIESILNTFLGGVFSGLFKDGISRDFQFTVIILIIIVGNSLLLQILKYFFDNPSSRKKDWRCKIRLNSFSKHIRLMIISEVMIVLAPLTSGLICLSFGISTIENFDFMLGGIIFYVFYFLILFIINKKKHILKANDRMKCKKIIEWFFVILPLALSFFMYISAVQNEKIILIIMFILLVLEELAGFIFLDNKDEYEYLKATIIFEDGTEIIGVDSYSIRIKHSILICKVENKEIRIIKKGLKVIEYYDKA